MTLLDHLRAIVRYWFVLLILLVVGAGAALLAVGLQGTSYSSTARLAIGPANVTDSTPTQVVSSLENSAIPATLVQLSSSVSLRNAAAAQAGYSTSGVSTSAAVANNSNVVEVDVRASSAKAAHDIAAALASGTIKQFQAIYPTFSVHTVDDATAGSNARPPLLLTGILGGILGLVVGYLIALLLAALGRESEQRRRRGEAVDAGYHANALGGQHTAGYQDEDLLTTGGPS